MSKITTLKAVQGLCKLETDAQLYQVALISQNTRLINATKRPRPKVRLYGQEKSGKRTNTSNLSQHQMPHCGIPKSKVADTAKGNYEPSQVQKPAMSNAGDVVDAKDKWRVPTQRTALEAVGTALNSKVSLSLLIITVSPKQFTKI